MEFVGIIKSMNLFEQKTVAFQPRDPQGNPVGEQQKIADYMAIDEEKLNALPEAQFNELRQNGALGAIYAHILSLLGWQRIIQRALIKQPQTAPTAAAPITPTTPGV